jgi:glycosyltransferase involved in cell wall biosynthesis
MLSILVLTRNEEVNLPHCLASVAFSDDIHVLDSVSTDRTPEIARAAGAHLTSRPFDNWAAHQNWALSNLPFKHPWVFYIDADEIVTPALREELLRTVAAPGENVAFQVQRRDFFWGTWLQHVQTTPFYLRLFRPEKMRYERLVNPISIPAGPTGRLTGYLDHFPFSKGINDWLDRHNKYATFEAQQIVANRTARPEPVSLRAALRAPDLQTRRYHQKELFYKLPARPVIKFLTLYLLKRGFLDGTAGLRYSILQSIYEYIIVLKTKELEAKPSSSPPS